jgi:cytochrome c oxidase subunit 4
MALSRLALVRQVAKNQAALGQLVRLSSSSSDTLPTTLRDKYYPKLGNRDIVGYGWNGYPTYIDRQEFPCPPVRFRENTPEVMALRAKEKGDWNKLTLEDKRALYRASFAQTFAEMNAPTGEWKSIVAMTLLGLSFTLWILLYCRRFVLQPLPRTINDEWQEKQLELMLKQRQNAVIGVGSKWDYENNRWK